ncbi:hypothetical protein [Ralstonia solanacearum]|uniref:hypothetical protein n=1 Tax=Ralstonia solanacearum TaxID=305 RepID=UPI000A644C42|nr:hypothetical protein [Ralstonia solanacearum]
MDIVVICGTNPCISNLVGNIFDFVGITNILDRWFSTAQYANFILRNKLRWLSNHCNLSRTPCRGRGEGRLNLAEEAWSPAEGDWRNSCWNFVVVRSHLQDFF